MRVRDLKPNPRNPRKITDDKLDQLRSSLEKFGDLSGVVYNRRSKQLIGGHQRANILGNSDINITKKYSKPTKSGTISVGTITFEGETYSYREVDFSTHREKAANIAANNNVGEWDISQLNSDLNDLEDFGFLGDTLFDKKQITQFRSRIKIKDLVIDVEMDASPKKNKKKVICPECAHAFTPGWSEVDA